MRKAGHAHAHREAQLLPFVHHDLGRAFAAQAFHARVRCGQPHARQQHGEAALVIAARSVHRTRAAAQQPSHCFEHALLARATQRQHLRAGWVELDEDDGELAVLACRQVDLAPQLVFEVRTAVQAGGRIAQRLVGQLALEQLVGALLLFDLLQRQTQLGLALTLRRQVGPDTAQPAPAGGVGCAGPAQDCKLAARTAPLESVLAAQRRRLCQGGVLGRPQGGGQHGLEQLDVVAAQHLGQRPLEKGRHGLVRVHVTAAGQVLDRQQLAVAQQHVRQQCGQQGLQLGGSLRRCGGYVDGHGRHGELVTPAYGLRAVPVGAGLHQSATPALSWCRVARHIKLGLHSRPWIGICIKLKLNHAFYRHENC